MVMYTGNLSCLDNSSSKVVNAKVVLDSMGEAFRMCLARSSNVPETLWEEALYMFVTGVISPERGILAKPSAFKLMNFFKKVRENIGWSYFFVSGLSLKSEEPSTNRSALEMGNRIASLLLWASAKAWKWANIVDFPIPESPLTMYLLSALDPVLWTISRSLESSTVRKRVSGCEYNSLYWSGLNEPAMCSFWMDSEGYLTKEFLMVSLFSATMEGSPLMRFSSACKASFL